MPSLCEFHPSICLTTEKNHGKSSVRVAEEENASIHITKTPTHYNTHTHTLQNNLQPPRYKSKQTLQFKTNDMPRFFQAYQVLWQVMYAYILINRWTANALISRSSFNIFLYNAYNSYLENVQNFSRSHL